LNLSPKVELCHAPEVEQLVTLFVLEVEQLVADSERFVTLFVLEVEQLVADSERFVTLARFTGGGAFRVKTLNHKKKHNN